MIRDARITEDKQRGAAFDRYYVTFTVLIPKAAVGNRAAQVVDNIQQKLKDSYFVETLIEDMQHDTTNRS